MSVFQTEETGPIPVTRSNKFKSMYGLYEPYFFMPLKTLELVKYQKICYGISI